MAILYSLLDREYVTFITSISHLSESSSCFTDLKVSVLESYNDKAFHFVFLKVTNIGTCKSKTVRNIFLYK